MTVSCTSLHPPFLTCVVAKRARCSNEKMSSLWPYCDPSSQNHVGSQVGGSDVVGEVILVKVNYQLVRWRKVFFNCVCNDLSTASCRELYLLPSPAVLQWLRTWIRDCLSPHSGWHVIKICRNACKNHMHTRFGPPQTKLVQYTL